MSSNPDLGIRSYEFCSHVRVTFCFSRSVPPSFCDAVNQFGGPILAFYVQCLRKDFIMIM